MRINLAEIPPDGRSYIWTSQTRELNPVLKDLIGSIPYHTEFFIKPLNSRDFEMSGSIRTEMPEVCSRCGLDFNLRINEKFRNILIPRQEDDRTGHYARVNHVSEVLEGGPEALEYEGVSFEMGEYLHEVVALAAPFNPKAPVDEKGDCSVCKIPVKEKLFSYDEEMPEEKPESPFNVLKNMKLN